MRIQISVENIKCGGCANSIRKQLQTIAAVESVEVDVENGLVIAQVSESSNTDNLRAELVAKLLKMGYPETGSVEGLKAVGAKAKSFVSCAVGKMSENES